MDTVVYKHPSDDDLRAFCRRNADPLALVEVDRHLTGCAECRERLESLCDAGALYAGARKALEHENAGDHLTYEEVRAAAEGYPSPAASRHFESCPSCRAEVEDLRRFIPSLQTAQTGITSRRQTWLWRAAAAILVTVSVLVWWSRRHAGEQYAVVLHDAGGLVGIDAAGRLHTPKPIPAEYEAALREALRNGRLTVPEFVQQSRGGREILLGTPGRTEGFRVRHPFGEASLTGHPRFEWDRLSGSATYQVRVYDHNYQLAAESPKSPATEWTPARELPPGQSYTWMVTATVGKQLVRAPAPPDAEARFSVLAKDSSARLEQARRDYPDAHLMLAVLFAQAGVLAEARAELDRLAQLNPGSSRVEQLRKAIPIS